MNTLAKNIDLNSEYILNSLQSPIIVINSTKKTIIYCNNATEIFLDTSGKNIVGKKINNIFKDDSYFISLINKSIRSNRSLNEYNVSIHTPKKNECIDIDN